MDSSFLSGQGGREWRYDNSGNDYQYYLGKGRSALEVVVTRHEDRPRKDYLQSVYSDRRDGRVNPILVVALHDGVATICGPTGEDPPVYREVRPSQAENVCRAALEKPDRLSAQKFLTAKLPQLDDSLPGVRNQGLLSTHELRAGVPQRDDWDQATENAQSAVPESSQKLVESLGYGRELLTDHSWILKDGTDGHDRAVAVFLEEGTSFDRAQEQFTGKSPVAYALNEADKKNLDYVIASRGGTLRLYTTNPEAGFGSRGKTDTYVEIDTDLLPEENAGYLWLLFSAEALRSDGTLHDIMERSKDYAADLGARLRERIYDDVVPNLAEAIARARDIDSPTKEELDETYQMTLVLLYRLLFIAYAEDERFLPLRRNDRYDERSLKRKAHRLHELVQENGEFDEGFTDHWQDVMRLSRSIHDGHNELGLPAYDGRLLSEDPEVSEAGARLSEIDLTNDEFGPALVSLLIDETDEGYEGPVDFRNIGVREFGVIYEGLLESELSVADRPLGIEKDDDDEKYVPVEPSSERVEVEEGEVYLHGQSGERKATGSYYTKTRFVEHLLDYSLEPALDDHIERIERIRDEEGDTAAAEVFFDLRVADIAMGSGHFLVGAVDRIESRLYSWLTENSLPQVEEELDNLQDAAEEAFKHTDYTPTIERGQLLRRQVARRCIYGVDLNPLATELARLSLWVHTFVPGLPLTFLDYNLVTGDSLAGIGTLEEAENLLGLGNQGDQMSFGFLTENQEIMEEIQNEINQLGRVADTSAQEVHEARHTREEIEDKLEGVRARLDILDASRLTDDIDGKAASQTDLDPTEHPSYDRSQEVLDPFSTFHFPVAFPEVFLKKGGFDAIIGNPPWDKVRFEPQQFWVTRDPGLNALPKSKRDDRREELRKQYPRQAQKEKREKQRREQYQDYVGHAYKDQSYGHHDYAKLFVERADDLLQEEGNLGYVLPRQSLVLSGWGKLRRRLLDKSRVTVLQARNSGGWIFEKLESRYMIVMITSSPTADEEETHVWPAIEKESAIQEISLSDTIRLSHDDLASLTTEKRMVIPWFNRDGARDIFLKMKSRARLSEKGGWITGTHDARWDFRSSGPHSHLSNGEPFSGCWRVFMTRHIKQFSIDESREFRRFVDPAELASEDNDLDRRGGSVRLDEGHPAVVFRHVSRNDDTRTIIATLLPEQEYVYCKGYVHSIAHAQQTKPVELLALVGYLNSFTCDWWARRIVDRHVSSPVINNLPIPEWEEDEVQRVGKLAAELIRRGGLQTLPGGYSVPVGGNASTLEEHEIRTRIEKIVADGFSLREEHYDTVLADFSSNACPDDLALKIKQSVSSTPVDPGDTLEGKGFGDEVSGRA